MTEWKRASAQELSKCGFLVVMHARGTDAYHLVPPHRAIDLVVEMRGDWVFFEVKAPK